MALNDEENMNKQRVAYILYYILYMHTVTDIDIIYIKAYLGDNPLYQ